MRYSTIARTAVRAVFRNGLRTALTMLGLVIGIASVIVLVGIGDGSNQDVRDKMKELGGDSVSAFLYDGALQYEDMTSLRELADVADVAPSKSVALKPSRGKAVSATAMVEATDEHYLSVRNLKMDRGRNLSAVDREQRSKVAVVGSDVADSLFKGEDPVGKKMKLSGDEFTVVGVLQDQGRSMGLNTGSVVLVPLATAVGMGEGAGIESVYAKASGEDGVDAAKRAVGAYLEGSKGFSPSTFMVMSQDEMLRAGSDIDDTLTLLLAGIAGISLVVAGIGVMNVMLVSVTERTREIGIKKALGARRSDILVQFLLEALVISVIGGVLGIAAGIALGMLTETIGMSFAASWVVVAVAVAASTGIGLVFGIFPACRASRKNPIEALRME